MKWIELSVEVHPEAVDAVANVFHEAGTGGVAIDQPLRHHIEGEEPLQFTGHPIVKAYLPNTSDAGDRERRIEASLWHLQAFALSPIGPLRRRELDEEDWAESWKEHFHPFRLGRVVIKPTWRDWEPQPGEIVLELDPGMAFGTGLHPTTALVMLALQDRVRPGMRVLDLGTGSGILALAAAAFGARVAALDSNEVAVEVAKQNVEANGLADRVQVGVGSIEHVAGEQFDLILANIIAKVLHDLAKPLAAALRPGAEILASGIIEERADLVRTAFAGVGLAMVDEQKDGDWYLMIAARPE